MTLAVGNKLGKLAPDDNADHKPVLVDSEAARIFEVLKIDGDQYSDAGFTVLLKRLE